MLFNVTKVARAITAIVILTAFSFLFSRVMAPDLAAASEEKIAIVYSGSVSADEARDILRLLQKNLPDVDLIPNEETWSDLKKIGVSDPEEVSTRTLQILLTRGEASTIYFVQARALKNKRVVSIARLTASERATKDFVCEQPVCLEMLSQTLLSSINEDVQPQPTPASPNFGTEPGRRVVLVSDHEITPKDYARIAATIGVMARDLVPPHEVWSALIIRGVFHRGALSAERLAELTVGDPEVRVFFIQREEVSNTVRLEVTLISDDKQTSREASSPLALWPDEAAEMIIGVHRDAKSAAIKDAAKKRGERNPLKRVRRQAPPREGGCADGSCFVSLVGILVEVPIDGLSPLGGLIAQTVGGWGQSRGALGFATHLSTSLGEYGAAFSFGIGPGLAYDLGSAGFAFGLEGGVWLVAPYELEAVGGPMLRTSISFAGEPKEIGHVMTSFSLTMSHTYVWDTSSDLSTNILGLSFGLGSSD